MTMTKVAVTIDTTLVHEVDELVRQRFFPNRSKAIQEALRDKLAKLRRQRLALQCAKLEPKAEKAFAEEGMDQELTAWPAY